MIFNGFSWRDFFGGGLYNVNNSIFERNISVPIIRNLRKVVKSIDKRMIDRILINYCKQNTSKLQSYFFPITLLRYWK